MRSKSKKKFVTTYDLASVVMALILIEKYLNPIIVIVILGTAAALFITYRIRKALKEDNTNDDIKIERRIIKYEEELELCDENEVDEDCSDLDGNVIVESACAVEEAEEEEGYLIDNDYEEEEAELMEEIPSKREDQIQEDDFEQENI